MRKVSIERLKMAKSLQEWSECHGEQSCHHSIHNQRAAVLGSVVPLWSGFADRRSLASMAAAALCITQVQRERSESERNREGEGERVRERPSRT